MLRVKKKYNSQGNEDSGFRIHILSDRKCIDENKKEGWCCTIAKATDRLQCAMAYSGFGKQKFNGKDIFVRNVGFYQELYCSTGELTVL